MKTKFWKKEGRRIIVEGGYDYYCKLDQLETEPFDVCGKLEDLVKMLYHYVVIICLIRYWDTGH